MCSKSEQFSEKIDIQCGKHSQKVMISGSTMLMGESDSPTASVVVVSLIFKG